MGDGGGDGGEGGGKRGERGPAPNMPNEIHFDVHPSQSAPTYTYVADSSTVDVAVSDAHPPSSANVIVLPLTDTVIV